MYNININVDGLEPNKFSSSLASLASETGIIDEDFFESLNA